MAAALVQSKVGTSALATTTVAFDAAPSAGNLLILSIASDAYNGSPDSGWTESTGMEQQTFHGGYKWWRVAVDATNSFTYTIGGAFASFWVFEEWSGLTSTPYDVSAGQFQQSFVQTYGTPTLTPSTGERLLHATIGTSQNATAQGVPGGWTSSFTAVNGTGGGTGETLAVATATRAVTGDGSTGFSTTATWTPQSAQSATAMIASFNVAGAASPPVNTVAPVVTGTPTQGQTLTTDDGTWTNTPTGYTYQWQRFTP
jgi:hypothetical protein